MVVTTPEPAPASNPPGGNPEMLTERHQQSTLVDSKDAQIVRVIVNGEHRNWRTYRNDSF